MSNSFVTPWTAAHQALLSMGFHRQYWSGFPFSSPGDLPNPGIKLLSLTSLALQADSLLLSQLGSPYKWYLLLILFLFYFLLILLLILSMGDKLWPISHLFSYWAVNVISPGYQSPYLFSSGQPNTIVLFYCSIQMLIFEALKKFK